MQPAFLPRDKLPELIRRLIDEGYLCFGPVETDGAVSLQPFEDVSTLAAGFVDLTSPGKYQLQQSENPSRIFTHSIGPQGLKPLLFKPRETLWRAVKTDEGIQFLEHEADAPAIACFGVRSCDLTALALQDKHFFDQDSHYRKRREQLFLIGVNCFRSTDTCFCHSTGDGPKISASVDIEMSELDDGFVIHQLSLRARMMMDDLLLTSTTEQQQAADQDIQNAASQQRQMPEQLHGKISERALSHVWLETAEQCLACGNCTAVCPSCFCSNQRDEVSSDLQSVQHFREWDSCFTQQHSYIHGKTIRQQTSERYRQWLTHKLDTWHDQYGRSGCTGCGRCISWCPAGIDITQVVSAVMESSS